MIGAGVLEFIKLAIFYASWLYFPGAFWLVWVITKRNGLARSIAVLSLLLITVLAYARFVEPRILLTMQHIVKLEQCYPKAGGIKLAVFSDTHNGLFANAMPVKRIVRAINASKPDAVFVAGDFTYFLHPKYYKRTFSPFSEIEAPVFGVLGNHDVDVPGPDMTDQLTAFLPTVGVELIDNKVRAISLNYEVFGLSDSWAGKQAIDLLEAPKKRPRIVLTHNPKTVWELPRNSFDLLVAGHTHGGQINLPGIPCKLVSFACHVKRYGYKMFPEGPVFVTSGTGMVGLP